MAASYVSVRSRETSVIAIARVSLITLKTAFSNCRILKRKEQETFPRSTEDDSKNRECMFLYTGMLVICSMNLCEIPYDKCHGKTETATSFDLRGNAILKGEL